MLGGLKNLFKGVLGGISHKASPIQTGAIYIKDELKKSGITREYDQTLLLELSGCAINFSEAMCQMSKKDKKVTYFVEHLDYIVSLLQQEKIEGTTSAPEPIKSILLSHGIKAVEPS